LSYIIVYNSTLNWTKDYKYLDYSFVYSQLLKALRMQEIDIILKIGFFVRDLHRKIERVYSQ